MNKITKYMVILTALLGLQVNIFASQTLDKDNSTANIDVNVVIPATVLSADVPLKLVCAINPEAKKIKDAFTAPNLNIKSNTNAPIDVELKIRSAGEIEIVSPTKKKWTELTIKETSRYMALGFSPKDNDTDGATKWAPDITTYKLKANESIESKIRAKHGMAFKRGKGFDFKITTIISLQ